MLLALVFLLIILAVTFYLKRPRGVAAQPIERMTDKQAQWIELNIITTTMNIQQTNWTVIVVPRTNSL